MLSRRYKMKHCIITAMKKTGHAIIDCRPTHPQELTKTINQLRLIGYNRFKIEYGYAIRCSWCNVIIGTSDVEHSHGICKTCAKGMASLKSSHLEQF